MEKLKKCTLSYYPCRGALRCKGVAGGGHSEIFTEFLNLSEILHENSTLPENFHKE